MRLGAEELRHRLLWLAQRRCRVHFRSFDERPVRETPGRGDRRYFMERRGDGVPIIRRETLGMSGRDAEFRIIGDDEVLVALPSAPVEPSPAQVRITVRASGRPLPGVEVLVLFPNHTWKGVNSDGEGIAPVSLHTTELPVTVFAAARGYAAHVEREWVPNQGALALELKAMPEGGAVIFREAIGAVPGLTGTLNPIRDTRDRTYLYASNIAINKGTPQPVHFVPGEGLRLTDADGRELLVRIVEIAGRAALVEYRPLGRDDPE